MRNVIYKQIGISFAAMLCSGTAWAQVPETNSSQPAASGSSESAEMPEILVTAQRRSERLQDVPVAVSAVSAAKLEASGIATSRDIHVSVPALYIGNAIGFTLPRLRGVGSTTLGPGIENSVAVYVDGVYYAATTANLLSFTNIERVEVLKGPQGTLFGRNATGGLIQAITRDPTSELSGSINASYANYQTVHADAYISSGLGENVAADFAVMYDMQGKGWGHNVFTGQEVDKTKYNIGMRSKVVVTPADGTKIKVSADYTTFKGNPFQPATKAGSFNPFTGPPFVPVGTTVPGFTNTIATPEGRFDTSQDRNDHLDYKNGGGSVNIEQELGGVKVVSITAYRKSQYNSRFDQDASPLPFSDVFIHQRDWQFSQELQLQSTTSGKLNWTAGLYYFNALSRFNPLSVDIVGIVPPPFVALHIDGRGTIKTDSYSAYLQGTYKILPDTNLTLGGRYTNETKSLSGNETDTGFLADGTAVPLAFLLPTQPSAKAKPFTFRIALDHHFGRDIMAYASMNRGFKSGGFNAGNLLDPAYKPEKLDAYEVGLKSQLFDRRFTANIALFYYDYTDVQVAKIEGASSGIVNGPSAEIYGIDADFEAKFSRQFQVTAAFTAMHTKLGTYLDAPVGTASGGFPQTTGEVTGNRLPLASKFAGSISPSYTVDLSDEASLRFDASIYYTTGWNWELDNLSKQKPFEQINLSTTLDYKNMTVSAFVNNLTDRLVLAANATDTLGIFYATYRAPRTYGLKVGYKF